MFTTEHGSTATSLQCSRFLLSWVQKCPHGHHNLPLSSQFLDPFHLKQLGTQPPIFRVPCKSCYSCNCTTSKSQIQTSLILMQPNLSSDTILFLCRGKGSHIPTAPHRRPASLGTIASASWIEPRVLKLRVWWLNKSEIYIVPGTNEFGFSGKGEQVKMEIAM